MRRLEAEWCQGEQVEQWAGSEEPCSGPRRRLGGARRHPVDKMKREAEGWEAKTRRGYESQNPSVERIVCECVLQMSTLCGAFLHLIRGYFRVKI